VSLIGQAKISIHVEKQAQWYVPSMLHIAMVLMSCTMGMWMHKMGVWISHNGDTDFEQWSKSVEHGLID
jgi:hypothetical protein